MISICWNSFLTSFKISSFTVLHISKFSFLTELRKLFYPSDFQILRAWAIGSPVIFLSPIKEPFFNWNNLSTRKENPLSVIWLSQHSLRWVKFLQFKLIRSRVESPIARASSKLSLYIPLKFFWNINSTPTLDNSIAFLIVKISVFSSSLSASYIANSSSRF